MYQLKLDNLLYSHDFSMNKNFKKAVAELDVSSDETFFEVISTFGTHFTTSVLMGGQYTRSRKTP